MEHFIKQVNRKKLKGYKVFTFCSSIMQLLQYCLRFFFFLFLNFCCSFMNLQKKKKKNEKTIRRYNYFFKYAIMGIQFGNKENYQKLVHVVGKKPNKDNKYLVKY